MSKRRGKQETFVESLRDVFHKFAENSKESFQPIREWYTKKKSTIRRMVITLTSVVLLYFPFVHTTEPGIVGIEYNVFTGEVVADTPGWNITLPWVLVAKIETRPQRVCLTTSARAFNCRLVEFVPEFVGEFIETEGFSYYWWANRFSYNPGYDEEYRGCRDILRGYGYSAKPYPFVRVIREYKE